MPERSLLRRVALLAAARFVIAASVFAAAQVLATEVLHADRMPLTLVVVATGIVAAVFWASNAGLEHSVDRLLFGAHASGFEAGRALLQRMANTLPVDEILPALAETAGRATHSARAEVRVLLSDGRPWSQVWPAPAVPGGSAPVTIGVRHAGTDVGEIEVDPTDEDRTDRDRILLDDLARPAGVALSTVRLTVELRRRAADLEALTDQLERSNRRIVQARRTEIARLRAEMQHRVTPHIERAVELVGTEMTAAPGAPGSLRSLEPPDQAGVPDTGALDGALGEVAEALESLRILARGIYPPRLADAGLAASLEGWQQRSGIGVVVRVSGDEKTLHRYPDVESCLYFSLVTALAAIGDPGTRPVATVQISDDWVDAAVTDGSALQGGSPAVRAAALQAVQDRVEAFDGQLRPSGSESAGPWLGLRLPLAQQPESLHPNTGGAL